MRDLTYPPVIVAAKAAFMGLGLQVQVEGSEHIPRKGGAVLAINHISYLDFIVAGYAARPAKRLVRFMAKRELFDHRLVGPLMRSLHHINVDRADGMESYTAALDYLAQGEVVGLFPEATISRSFEIKELKTGTVRMATQADVPLLPMVLWGSQRVYTKDHPRDLSRGKVVTVHVGPPLQLTRSPIADTAQLRGQMGALLDSAISTYPQHEAGAWWVPRSRGGSAPSVEDARAAERAEARARAEKRRAARTAPS